MTTCLSEDEVAQLLNIDYYVLKTAIGPLDLSLELIATSVDVGIHMMLEVFQRLLDGLRIPAE